MEPRIRDATAADAQGLATLMTALGYPTTEQQMAHRLAGILPQPEYATFVAESDGTTVGAAGAMIGRFYEKDGIYARLTVLVVDSANRSHGVGAALVRAVERWATAQGATEVVVNSSNHRADAHRFYERAGYDATGVRFVKRLSPI